MNFFSTNFNGDPNLGMYGYATKKYAILGIDKKIDALGVNIFESSVAGTPFVGMFSAGNSEKIIVTKLIEDEELKKLKEIADVHVLKSKFTAVGNLILMNDNGCVISPLISEHKKEIEDFLGIECAISKIADINVVGSCAACNNSRCAVHPGIKLEEKKILEDILKVKVGVATSNFGSPFLGSCIIVNDNAVVTSEHTTGPELSMLNEAFF